MNVLPFNLGLRLLKAFGWQGVLTLSLVQLLWIWRALMEEKEARYFFKEDSLLE